VREHRTQAGNLIYYATRAELERLPGYRGNDQRGRARCPIHNSNNPTTLAIDWGTGWAHCFSCGDAFAIRVEDHPDAILPDDRGVKIKHPRDNVPQARQNAPESTKAPTRQQSPSDALATLERDLAGAASALPGSPGAAYLAGRGIPLDVAQSLGLGWGAAPIAGKLAGRVIFPLTDPAGRVTSAYGRALDDRTKPKYDTLPRDAGYRKTLFNGGAIAQAKRTGAPLVIVEGPMDAAACVAAGIPLTVAICGASYAHPADFYGLDTVILALDSDETGQEKRGALFLDLIMRGVRVLPLPAAALGACKDLGEYWQTHRAMPIQLAADVIGPHMRGIGTLGQAATRDPAPATPVAERIEGGAFWRDPAPDPAPDPRSAAPSIECDPFAGATPTARELAERGAEVERRRWESRPDLPAELIADAEADAADLAQDATRLADFEAEIDRERARLETDDPDLLRAAEYAIELARAAFDHLHLGA